MFTTFFATTLIVGMSCALAIPPAISSRAAGDQAAVQLLQIAPTSGTCDGAAYPTECATNVQAAPFLIQAMSDYGITSPPEIAAVLALIAYESGDFKFNTNHFPTPGNPGQGTRAMMMPNFVTEYAQSIPALKDKVVTGTTADQLNANRALVLPDEYTWAAAPWYLTTKCSEVRTQIQTGGEAGFSAYMKCLGVDAGSDRLAYWNRASAAFGLA
jgi:hypothetical protein